tara:strand:- start:51 stop:674 length:624 start_codon:yes stop_codon:yes gene_type:complete
MVELEVVRLRVPVLVHLVILVQTAEIEQEAFQSQLREELLFRPQLRMGEPELLQVVLVELMGVAAEAEAAMMITLLAMVVLEELLVLVAVEVEEGLVTELPALAVTEQQAVYTFFLPYLLMQVCLVDKAEAAAVEQDRGQATLAAAQAQAEAVRMEFSLLKQVKVMVLVERGLLELLVRDTLQGGIKLAMVVLEVQAATAAERQDFV